MKEQGREERPGRERRRKRYHKVSADVSVVLEELIFDLAMAVPVERISHPRHGDGVSLKLGTKQEGETGEVRLYPAKRLAEVRGGGYWVAVQGLEWVEPAEHGVRLSGSFGDERITVLAGVSGEVYMRVGVAREAAYPLEQ